jgi:hypothetical protein
VFAALLLAGLGCGSSATTPDAAGDAAASSDAALDGADALDGGECNAIAQLGDPVTTSCDAGAAPAMTGGSIVDGTYLLTESHFFGNCDESVLSETLVVSQGTAQSITTDATTGMSSRRNLTIATTSGSSTLTQTETCPINLVATVGFSATPAQLTIRMSNALGSRVSMFALQ